MAQTYFPVRLTPLAALLHAELRNATGRGLADTLAIARTPGKDWKTYDEIADMLTPYANGRTLNRVSLKTFAEAVFGLPNTRYVNVDGKAVAMPKAVDQDVTDRYLAALDARFIDVALVRAFTEARNDTREAPMADEFVPYLDEALTDPAVRDAYEAEEKQAAHDAHYRDKFDEGTDRA